VEKLSENPMLVLKNLELHVSYLTQTILAFEGLDDPAAGTQIARLNTLNNRGYLPTALIPFFHTLAGKNHGNNTSSAAIRMQANLHLKLAAHLTTWFLKSYGPYLPSSAAATSSAEDFFQELRMQVSADSVRRASRKSAKRRASTITLQEDETRVIIDYQLQTAGWQADTLSMRYALGARPEKGADKAIAEWPTETGTADYALFSGLDLIGVIEAKKMGNDFKVPFLFATNARPYLEQLKEKSGIWFLDVRDPANHPRPLQGWYSAEELRALLLQDIPAAHAKLTHEPMDYLGLRDYQEKAIRQIETALDQGQTRLLIAMATGTGKTRLAISLIYRLIKSRRFRRILFVVDRNALGEQAGDKFKETHLEELKTFDQIYDLKEVGVNGIESSTKVRIATVQALMHAIMYPSDPADIPSVGKYDCIIKEQTKQLTAKVKKDQPFSAVARTCLLVSGYPWAQGIAFSG
jgi:type I restriction enzyme, R subunit